MEDTQEARGHSSRLMQAPRAAVTSSTAINLRTSFSGEQLILTLRSTNQMTDLLLNWLTIAWQATSANIGWMSWNSFLAIIPLALSLWLFCSPKSPQPKKMASIQVGLVGLLLSLSFLPHAERVAQQLTRLIKAVDGNYLILVAAITLLLTVVEIWQVNRHKTGKSYLRLVRWWMGFLVFILFLPNAPYVLTDVIHLIEQIRQGYSVWIITLALIPQYLLFMFIGFEAYVLSVIYLERDLERMGWRQHRWLAEWVIHGLSAIGIYLGRFQRFNSWDILTNPDLLIQSVIHDLLNQRPMLIISVTFVVIGTLYNLFKALNSAFLSKSSSPISA